MAIFRKGVKIGGYDIRVGFPRDRSMDNIDKDPRVKQKANPDTTINKFRAMTQAAGGYAKPTKYIIQCTLPTAIQLSGLNKGVASDFNDARAMQNNMGEQVAFHCDSLEFPGRTIETDTTRYHGPERTYATGLNFAPITATFYCDKFMKEKHYFETWQNCTINKRNYELNYYDEYVTPMTIYQLSDFDANSTGDSHKGISSDNPYANAVYAVRLFECFPSTIAAQPLGYDNKNQIHKVSITFEYRFWANMTDISEVEKDDTYMTQQTGIVTADTKGQGPFGLFRHLPSELRRAGNNVFSQAKNRMNPIGRVFGGKVFPPF
tara:strand:- start:1186 stop:2145 length:960 start_codon:yes stop_codon:yes gene_type:complete